MKDTIYMVFSLFFEQEKRGKRSFVFLNKGQELFSTDYFYGIVYSVN